MSSREMRKSMCTALAAITLVSSIGIAAANIPDADREQILEKMNIVVNAVNNADTRAIHNIVSANASETFRQDIQKNIEGKSIRYQQNIGNFEAIADDTIKVTGRFAAEGINWSISGLSNYFIFEKVGNDWYLLESDFAQKLDTQYVVKFIGKIFMFIAPIFLALFAFWIWMVVDVAKRPLPGKTKWLLIVVVFNWLGALVYFVFARRKHIKSLALNQGLSSV